MDLREKIRKCNANHLRLERNGQAIIPFNKTAKDLPKKLQQIFDYLEAYPDEQFTIVGRTEFRNGNVVEENISHSKLIVNNDKSLDSIAEEFNSMKQTEAIEIEILKIRLEAKYKELQEANDFIDELQDEIERLKNEPGEIADNQPPAYVNTLINLGAGLLDKYMQQRDEMIKLEREKLQQYEKQDRERPE